MLAGDFARKLRKLNPELRIYCKDDDTKPAGLYFVRRGEYRDLCGVDKNFVPEFKMGLWNGTIKKQGWRDVIMMLIARKMVDRRKAERLFCTSFTYRSPFVFVIDSAHDPLRNKRTEMMHASQQGDTIITHRDLAELAEKRKRRDQGEN